MNKTAIKNYAIRARVQLIEAARQKAYEYEITDNGENKSGLDMVGGRLLTKTEKEQRNQLISEINRKGFSQVMEEAAYTWFNRFIALRFMEVNGYLPSKVRVFTDENGAFKPEILKQAISLDIEGLDRNKVLNLLDKQDNEELFKYLLITQCNALNAGLPYMFEKISNWTELLFPANLLRQDSVIGQMISEIPEEDWTDAVQIIGWLYQYYNSELKDETFALLKKNVKITKERIPAATQLFTPDWIVRYMVENSLGRLAVSGSLLAVSNEAERIAKEKNIAESFGWKYYLPEAEQTPDVREKLTANSQQLTAMDPTTLRVLDPCMGSGHILVYAFDVLMQIYISAGWSERDAAKSILENNLYGLDIDDRAGQLAYFAVMMKARKFNRRILNGETKPNVLSIQDSNRMTDEFIDYAAGKDPQIRADLVLLRKTYKDAKEYGSILTVPPLNFAALYERIDILGRSYLESLTEVAYQKAAKDLLLPLVKQAEIMAQKYDVVVTNPPYMGSSGMSAKLGDFVKNNYPDSKSDLFAVFIERCGAMLKPNGYQAMITQHAWMFLSSFERLRAKLLTRDTVNMAHLGPRAFEEIGGEVVQTTSFVLKNVHTNNYKGTYCRLIDPTTQQGKEDMFLAGENRYTATQDNFSIIPGSPVAYWVSTSIRNAFYVGRLLGSIAQPKQGMVTRDNNRFMRLWWEPSFSNIERFAFSHDDSRMSDRKWYFCTSGGSFRKWYGNIESVVNFKHDGKEIIEYSGPHIKNREYYFRESITWSAISSSKLSMRYAPSGTLPEHAGNCLYGTTNQLKLIQALTNSNVGLTFLSVLSPTLNYNVGDISNIPMLNAENKELTYELVDTLRYDSKEDWDAFETSCDFKKHPLV